MVPRPLPATCLAETLGTFLLVFFGCGSVHVAVLIGDLAGGWQVGIVWGLSIMLAIYVFGSISGAHINPAVTIGLATWGLFPARRILPYVISQFAGAVLAAAVLFVLFQPYLRAKEASKQVERGQPGSQITAMCYGEYFPNPGSLAAGDQPFQPSEQVQLQRFVSEPVACFAEWLGTAILALVIVSVTEPKRAGGPRHLAPVFIGLTVTALICVLAPLTQACFNPARDFGPRLFAYFAGWGEIALLGPREFSFLTVYGLSPILGAISGIGFYQSILKRYVLDPDISAELDAFQDAAAQ